MAQTKMLMRILSDQIHLAAVGRATAAPVRRKRQPRQRIGVKNIEERIRSRTFKIKRLMAEPKNINVKKNDNFF